MIDIEPQVFDRIYRRVKAQFPNVKMESITNLSPTTFPYVGLEQADSFAHKSSRSSSSNENYSEVVFEVNVFAIGDARKSQVKKILSVIDDEFNSIGFTRYNATPIPLGDGKTFRMFSRYRAVVSKENTIYKR